MDRAVVSFLTATGKRYGRSEAVQGIIRGMELTEISCAGYKVFRDALNLEIRPLTVLVGKNNAGKSALARLPILLGHALSSGSRGELLDLRVGHLRFGSGFLDLIYRRRQHGELSLGARFEGGTQCVELDVTIQNLSRLDHDEPVVASYRLSGADVDLDFTWERTPEKPPRYVSVAPLRGDEGIGPVEFSGLLPHAADPIFPEATRSALGAWRERFGDFFQQLSHLGPLRPPIPPFSEKATRNLEGLGESGVLAPQWLEAEDALLERVSAWYRENLDGWSVRLDESFRGFECRLHRASSSVRFADSGEGMSQVLPVVVQQLLHRVRDAGSSFDIVEHPELHLHPAAHAGLADLYVDSAATCTGLRILVETHSENFILRLRRRIAEGKLDPGKVALYWVEELPRGQGSAVRRIEILPDGTVSDWPAGVFSESYDEVRAIRRAARGVSEDSQ